MPKNAVLGSILSLGLLFGSLVYGQMGMPQQNISGKRHPNLAAAQRLCDQAFEKIQAAQQERPHVVPVHILRHGPRT